jgi:hypothetical protein
MIKRQNVKHDLWDYGEWLKKYLKKDIREHDLRDLANKAIELLNLNYSINDFDISFYHIKEIGEKNNNNENIFVNWQKLIDKKNKNLKKSINEKTIKNNLSEYANSQFYIVESDKYEVLINLNSFRKLINLILINLIELKKPWEHALVDIGKQFEFEFQSFFPAYEQLTNTFIISGNKYKKVKNFVFDREIGEYFFMWDTVITHIFINFLSLGGQNYYGFCEHCGDFFLVQRKGKKRFCKDVCRVQANRALKNNSS